MSVNIDVTASPISSRMSWSFSNKDTNGDKAVSFAEYMAPVPEGGSVLQPADMEHAESMQDLFKSFDHDKDGKVTEAELQSPPTHNFAKSLATLPSDMETLAKIVAMYKANGNPDALQTIHKADPTDTSNATPVASAPPAHSVA